MRYFLDTSSLIKLYHTEQDSATLRAFFRDSDTFVVTDLTWVEARSAFGRKVRRGELSLAQAAISLDFLAEDWSQFERLALPTDLLRQAADLLTKHHTLALRSLDAIQLAAALAAGPLDGFFTHDTRLRTAALAEGLPVR